MSNKKREYECIVFGATGYTGKYTSEHITTNLPTDFKWAVAGRSETKLKALVEELKTLNSNRPAPAIEVTQLDKAALVSLAKRTKILISTVGPYHKYGTPAFEACAETGTHYLDVTGESPWVYDMVHRFHKKAQQTGAIMIPQNGVESAPTDLMSWMLVSEIRRTLGVGTAEVVNTVYDVKGTPSGGTFNTILTLFDSYSLPQLAERGKPWAICPISPPKNDHVKPLLEKLTGVRSVADLGTLTTSIQASTDNALIQRSWGLHDRGKFYGPKFNVTGYMQVRNALRGLGLHLATNLGLMLLLLPPVRWFLSRFVFQPGDGPTREQSKDDYMEWRSIAEAEAADLNDPKRAYGRMRWQGNMYHLTGVFLAEAALTISRDKTYAHELGGGVLTPSTLGEAYLSRLNKAGLRTEVKMIP